MASADGGTRLAGARRMTMTHFCAAFLFMACCGGLPACNTSGAESAAAESAGESKKSKKKKGKKKKGPRTETSAEPTDRTAKDAPAAVLPAPIIMGAPGMLENLIITVRNVDDVAPTPKSERPAEGQKLLAVSLLVGAQSGSAMVAGAMFDLVTQDGQRYRSSILPCTDTPLKAGSATPSAPIEGDLCFIVPKDTKLQLMFKSGGKDALPFKLGF